MSRLSRYSPILCCMLALLAAPAHAVQDCEIDGVAVNPANGYTTAGKSGMMRCRDRDTGQLQREQQVSQGKFTGLVRNYRNGKLALEYSVNDKGNRDGRARELSESGKVLREETYSDGRAIGIGRSFYPDGRLKRATFFNEAGREQAFVQYGSSGRLTDIHCADHPVLGTTVDDATLCGHHGKVSEVRLYLSSGALHARIDYLAGKRQHLRTYWPNGKPSSETDFGATTRTERAFSEAGITTREERWSLLDGAMVKESEQLFHETRGTLTSERRWVKGQLAAERTFYLNGQPRRTLIYETEGDVQTAQVEDFYDDGRVSAKGRYMVTRNRGKQPMGVQQQFDRQGRLRVEMEYDNTGGLEAVREWSETGVQTRNDEVFEDGSRKPRG